MKIQLLRNTVADGRSVSVGQEVEVADATGRALVQMGKAREIAREIAVEMMDQGSDPSTPSAKNADSAQDDAGAPAAEPAVEPMGGLLAPAAPPTRHSKQSKGKVGK